MNLLLHLAEYLAEALQEALVVVQAVAPARSADVVYFENAISFTFSGEM